uniref:Uncharacterized protein n=1 Tax=viral metagenome TaxID=1070528 RepID=A0A6C0CRK5_9ZZZZ
MDTLTYLVIATIINGFTNFVLLILFHQVYNRTKQLAYNTSQISAI